MQAGHVRGAALLAAMIAVSGCATVRSSRIAPDYAQVDQHRTKRLVVVTAPNPGEAEKLGELWSLLARRYTNQHRDFLVKENRPAPEGVTAAAIARFEPQSLCAEGLEGVLWLRPTEWKDEGENLRASLVARLVGCPDGHEVWSAEAGGSWKKQDAQLEAFTAEYVDELGEDVAPYVAPSFRLLKATLDTLPNPTLTDEDIDEKIELGQ